MQSSMNTKKKYVFPVFAAVFALMFVAATPYVIAEPGEEKRWEHDGAYDHANMKQDMTEKLNSYCQMSASEQSALIEKHNKTEEMVAKMNEYCSLDEAGRQAFIEEYKDEYKKHLGDKMNHKYKKHHVVIKVEGFTGNITVPYMSEETDMKAAHDAIKAQINVKLSEAAAAAENTGLDVMKGSVGMVVNEDNVKSVAWILTAINMDADSQKMSKTIFVVDAAKNDDGSLNTAQTTKEFDHSMKDKSSHDRKYDKTSLSDPEKIQDKIAKIEEKLVKGTGNAETDAMKAQFVDVLKQLQAAITNDDDAQADSLREQLKDLRNQMVDMKKFR